MIHLSRSPTALMRRLGVPFVEPSPSQAAATGHIEERQRERCVPDDLPVPPSPTSGRWNVVVRNPLAFSNVSTEEWNPILSIGNVAVAGVLRRGKGALIVVGDPDIVSNSAILKGENLEFVRSFLGDGPVLFDEYSHGLRREGTLTGLLKEFSLIPFLCQIAVVFALYFLAHRARRASVSEPAERSRSTLQQIAMLSGLYRASLTKKETEDRVRSEVERRLGTILGASVGEVGKRLSTPGQQDQRLSDIHRRCRPESFGTTLKESRRRCVRLLAESHLLLRELVHERTRKHRAT